MDPNVQALIAAMQKQQEQFQTLLASLQGLSNTETSAPKFDTFDKSAERWEQYY